MVVLGEIAEDSSSSSSTHEYQFDVFLSFRGADTRLSFTNHLFKMQISKPFWTMKRLKPELESAIKASRASIIVLSKNYTFSTWCLDELVLILKQYRSSNHIVIPIFYHVEPTHVRKQENIFGDAMAKHKQRMEEETNAEKKKSIGSKDGVMETSTFICCSSKRKRSKQQLLRSLKILDLNFCAHLHSVGGFLELPVLQSLIVRDCTSLLEVCESIEQCVELVLIDMSNCYKLRKLPRSIGKLKKVKTLLLDGCTSLESLIQIWDMDSSEIHVPGLDIHSQTSSSTIMEAILGVLKSVGLWRFIFHVH